MIDVNFPFLKNQELLKQYLLESEFDNKFTFKHKLYYSAIRPFIPRLIRKLLQKQVNNKIDYHKDFIWKEFVDLVFGYMRVTEVGGQKYLEGFAQPEIGRQKTEDRGSNITEFKYKSEKDCAIVLTHDVEEQEGFNFIPKVLELEEQYGFKSSWNIVPYKYKIDQGIINLIKNNGYEIGIHGYNHDGKLYYSEKIFNQRVSFINQALKKYDAVGFRSPQVHRNLIWLQKLDIEYDASCFDYDLFQPFPGGTGSIWPFIAGNFVELPYTLPQDHTMFYVLKQRDISIWKNKADWVAKNKGVILTLTHPDYLTDKNHFSMYEELLSYLKTFENAWFCLPREMAKWWRGFC